MSGIIIIMIYSDMNHSYDANQGAWYYCRDILMGVPNLF